MTATTPVRPETVTLTIEERSVKAVNQRRVFVACRR
jgi:hypothetical protein